MSLSLALSGVMTSADDVLCSQCRGHTRVESGGCYTVKCKQCDGRGYTKRIKVDCSALVDGILKRENVVVAEKDTIAVKTVEVAEAAIIPKRRGRPPKVVVDATAGL
jgi:hypothetical protein